MSLCFGEKLLQRLGIRGLASFGSGGIDLGVVGRGRRVRFCLCLGSLGASRVEQAVGIILLCKDRGWEQCRYGNEGTGGGDDLHGFVDVNRYERDWRTKEME